MKNESSATCFIDHIDSYATNEVTIYWNSPTVFAVAHWNVYRDMIDSCE
ncbi:glycoside hydrolase family 9 protein [Gracilibacillus marinus]|uniref:Glycoside hydrolase family 9 protein n=1 Tax=Gracilibacillus marinus TaxID=630535 RepID=A0ABV8W003_9BACI